MDCLASVRTSVHLIEIEILALLDDTSYHAILGIRDNYEQNDIYIHIGSNNRVLGYLQSVDALDKNRGFSNIR